MSDRAGPMEPAGQPPAPVEERELSPKEFEDWVQAPVSPEERRHAETLIDWFLRRYPRPADRLAYIRRHALARRSGRL